jgi:hypothetical protein
MVRCKYRKKYVQQKSNAKQRGIAFLISFEEWKSLWIESGKWGERGRGANKYCMCRVGDMGAYEIGNVFIALGKKNVSEGNLGRRDSVETRRKKSEALKGIPHPWCSGVNSPMHRPEVKAKMSAAVGGGNNYKAKMVVSPFGVFGSTTEAAKSLGIPAVTVQWRCRHNKQGWFYVVPRSNKYYAAITQRKQEETKWKT